MKIVYDEQLMKYIALVENLTKVNVKDMFLKNNMLYCVIDKENLRKIIGPNGSKIKRIENLIKKKIKILGYSSNVNEFVKDLVYPFKIDKVEDTEGVVNIYCKDTKTKGLLIGRERRNLLNFKEITKRYFPIQDLKVI